MTLHIARRGRPPKSASVAPAPVVRPNHEVLEDLKYRFSMLGKLTTGATQSNIRAMVVSGSAGVGKTYTVEHVLEQSGTHYEVVKGTLSALHLFKLGYKYRKRGNVVVLDDADGIFTDEEALNILKALCDSSATRRVSYLKESAVLAAEDIPTTYEFEGAFIFISNIDFQKYVDMGGNKFVAHFQALLSRSLYLDLRLHTRQAIALWVKHVATEGKMFAKEGVSESVGERILAFIDRYKEDLRELSLRTITHASGLAKSHPDEWEAMAKELLVRG
jgi:hypothetical protein